jgi:hypothetical protein
MTGTACVGCFGNRRRNSTKFDDQTLVLADKELIIHAYDSMSLMHLSLCMCVRCAYVVIPDPYTTPRIECEEDRKKAARRASSSQERRAGAIFCQSQILGWGWVGVGVGVGEGGEWVGVRMKVGGRGWG